MLSGLCWLPRVGRSDAWTLCWRGRASAAPPRFRRQEAQAPANRRSRPSGTTPSARDRRCASSTGPRAFRVVARWPSACDAPPWPPRHVVGGWLYADGALVSASGGCRLPPGAPRGFAFACRVAPGTVLRPAASYGSGPASPRGTRWATRAACPGASPSGPRGAGEASEEAARALTRINDVLWSWRAMGNDPAPPEPTHGERCARSAAAGIDCRSATGSARRWPSSGSRACSGRRSG